MTTEQFRGDARDERIIHAIDPNRPHRFVQKEVGAANSCVLCDHRLGHDVHADDAKQLTVEYRDRAAQERLLREARLL